MTETAPSAFDQVQRGYLNRLFIKADEWLNRLQQAIDRPNNGLLITASATLTIPANADFISLTGTTPITSINSRRHRVGDIIIIRASAAGVNFVNSALLRVKQGTNRTMAVGDIATFIYLGSNAWQELTYTLF
jgi:hypothetical protein